MSIKKPHLALKKKALAAIKNLELDISKLTEADVHNLPMPLKIRNVLASMVGTDATVEKIEKELADHQAQESTYSEVTETVKPEHFDPEVEIKEKVTDAYVEEKVEVVEEDAPEEGPAMYTHDELAAFAAKAPAKTKTATALTKFVVAEVEDKELIDSALLTKVAKAEAASRKK